MIICCLGMHSQTTEVNGTFTTGGTEHNGRLKTVEIRQDGVIVTIEVKAQKALKRLNVFFSNNTYILSGDARLLLLSGILINNRVENCGPGSNWGWENVPIGQTRIFSLFFKGSLPSGITNFSMVDFGDSRGAHGYCFRNFTVNNPRRNFVDISSEYAAKQNIDSNNDGVCGIYETVDGSGANLACVKYNGEYKLIYLSSPSSYTYRYIWNIGDIKANLRQTAAGVMKADWYNSAKQLCNSAYAAFDGITLKVAVDGDELMYLKTYPTTSPKVGGISSGGWTGTGFALKNGYIVTNNHVVENSTSIVVLGVNGDHNTEYEATVVGVDAKNDLALIRITDSRFRGFANVPYAIVNRQCEVGEDVFVLGYPLTTYMGEEIKLTNGIISSRSGYQGDITTYQISAPVQPGNSGGPMFDKNGNIVGIVNAGIPGAENVGYAIKSSYLFTLVSSVASTANIPQTNQVKGTALSEKVKAVKNCVYFLKCQ